MKSYLITGANGFLGRHLRRRLPPEQTTSVDSFISSDRVMGVRDLDVTRPAFLTAAREWVSETEEPVIFHMAGIASPYHYRRHPFEALDASIVGTRHVLEAATLNPRTRVVVMSSSEIYGDPPADAVPTKETYRGNVACLGPRACYDAETEILTENGWVPFPSLKQGDAVATLTEAGKVEYHVPDEIISYPYVGELLRFENAKYDLCVTPNHKMYVRSKVGDMRFLRADEDRYWPAWKVPTGGEWEGVEVEWRDFGPPPRDAKTSLGRIRMDDWLEFLGYYISEGCVHERFRERVVNGRAYGTSDYNVLIAQEKPEGRSAIGDCLTRIGWNYFDSDHHQFRVSSVQLFNELSPLGKSADKYIPRDYMGLSVRQSRILLDALILGDGSVRGERAFYYTKSRRLADDVQELALRCGYAASRVSVTGRELFCVNIRRAREAKLTKPTKVRYAGNVHCVDVRNHVICVRRNGRAAWCGNCYDEGKRVAETLCQLYAERHGVNVSIIRPFNVYGPGMSATDYRVMPQIREAKRLGTKMRVFGTGQQTRTFCYVDDAIDGILAVAERGAAGEPYNIGNPEPEISMIDLCLLAIVQVELVPYPQEYPGDEPMRRCPDISKARALGYAPKVGLVEGLGRFFDAN